MAIDALPSPYNAQALKDILGPARIDILGYSNSLKKSEPSNCHTGIQTTDSGELQILKDKEWVALSHCNFRFDPTKRHLVTQEKPEEVWTYQMPDGFVQKSRFLPPCLPSDPLPPAYQLSSSEMDILEKEGKKYQYPDKKENPKEKYYLQVFTSAVHKAIDVSHVGLRLIEPDGKVYSLGFENKSIASVVSAQPLKTYQAAISLRDFDEFRPFQKRRVTTIPITQKQFLAAAEKVKTYTRENISFNILNQNCVAYVTAVMEAAGITPPIINTGLFTFCLDIVISTMGFGTAIFKIRRAVQSFFKRIVDFIPKSIRTFIWILTFPIHWPLSKLGLIFRNLLIVILGGTVGVQEEEKSENNQKSRLSFTALIKNKADFFKRRIGIVRSTIPFVAWQTSQPSTYIHRYDGPRFYIVPSQTTTERVG